MQVCYKNIAFLLLLTSTAICISIRYPESSLSTRKDARQRIECDPRTKRPTNPSFNDCEEFLEHLSIKSHNGPSGAYKWYGRNIGMCDECVKLPTVIHFGNLKCAALIEVDDGNEKEIDIFDLRDLWLALSNVIGFCWLRERHNGRGYPSSHKTWEAFVRGVGVRSGNFMEIPLHLDNGTMTMIDLDSEGRTVRLVPLL